MDPGSGDGGGGGSSRGSSSDSVPDCWDQADMEAPGSGPCGGAGGPLAAVAAEAQREHLSAAFSRQLHVSAKPFVPNVHAAEFVPSFLRGPAQPSPVPTTTEPAVARDALLHLWNLLKRNNHVKVQIQLLAWKFQNLLMLASQPLEDE
ncbi:eukaryotic peptide chain release factor GTP-binding subunit ERF3A-like isoform X2 [Manis javanica]|uniref:eukaryotic peptide chain release factor GTP-binding subunit ERF3A-like isoform X2 n=1 Tax=Manis javanica TaxID=9974 RepID=UPI003C6D72FF